MKGKSAFIVFMPFQLFVAQQVVRQEKLKDCILIEGYRSFFPHFADIYDLIRIDDMWLQIVDFEDIAAIDHPELPFLEGCKRALKSIRRLKKIVSDNNIEYIYLGEIRNQALRFICKYFSHIGCKIRYFEEGVSHYRPLNEKDNNSFINRCKIVLSDLFYYLPFYHIRFGKWRYNSLRQIKGLPIDRRYSIVDGYNNEPFDVRLSIEPIFSVRMREYIDSAISDKSEKLTLLMTDPVAEFIGLENMDLYYDTIFEKINSMDHNTKIYIKFHHRESEEQKRKTIEVVKSTGVPYDILASQINIPVEYYLQSCNIKDVLIFNASTYIYNGTIFPYVEFTKLLPVLYKKLVGRGGIDLRKYETFMNLMK